MEKRYFKAMIRCEDGELYSLECDAPYKINSRKESKEILNSIIEETIDYLGENCKIWVYGEVIYKNGKTQKLDILYKCGPLYEKLINYYDAILQY